MRFERGIGSQLHSELVAQEAAAAISGEAPFSYIERVWEDGYLEFRGPSPINLCPCLSIKQIPKVASQAAAASKFSCGIAQWVVHARTDGVRYDLGVDASQLLFQFSTARIPRAERDAMIQGSLESTNRMTVLRNGHVYLVDVIDSDGVAISEECLKSTLQHIIDSTSTEENHTSIGVLTAGSRNDWAASFAELSRDPANEEKLKQIATSLFVLNLDSAELNSPQEVQKSMLFGGTEPGNRLYDKHQIIVSKTGQIAVNFEHAFTDGMSWCTWIEDVYSYCLSSPQPGSMKMPTIEKIDFSFGKSFATRIRNAKQDLQKLTESIDVASPILDFGKKQLKLCGVSSDAFTQMCLQCAYFKTHGKLAPTYESCSTNKFFHGRTETLRTATSEMLNLVHAIHSSPRDAELIKNAIKQVSEVHVKMGSEASNGLGVDRHLLALQKLAQQKQCTEATEFFKEDLYSYSGTWLMSTSNISRSFLDYFSFGPVTPDGYGIGYVIDDDFIRLSVTSWKSSSLTDSTEMKNAIEKSGHDLLSILTKQ